jgi:hypothetical protein
MVMTVRGISVTPAGDMTRASAVVISPWWEHPRHVWFEVPSEYASPSALTSADPWVAALLVSAMRQREDLVVDAPLSPELQVALPQIQRIYTTWLRPAAPVEVRTIGRRTPESSSDAVALFFSCGVDSWYSLLKSQDRRRIGRVDEISHLLTVHGVDIDVGPWKMDVARELFRNARRVADDLCLPALAISTNIRRFYSATGLSWHWGQAGALAAIMLLLQDSFRRTVVAAGPDNATLLEHPEMPAGSCHPLLVPLFSTAMCELVVDGGEASRLQRVERLARSTLALETLRVCWATDQPGYNCGRCAKCIRTSLELAVFGALGRCPTLPQALDVDALAAVSVLFPHDVPLLRERRERLAGPGMSREVLDALGKGIAQGERVLAARVRALGEIGELVPWDEPFAILDEDEIRYELAATHARVLPFTERDGLFNGLPAHDDAALDEIGRLRAIGVTRLVVWQNDFWALDHYHAFRDHLESRCPRLAATPRIKVYDIGGDR